MVGNDIRDREIENINNKIYFNLVFLFTILIL